MGWAGDELSALLAGASKTARGSAAKGTGVRQKRILNATVTSNSANGACNAMIDGANTASPVLLPTAYTANTGDRILVTKIGPSLQLVTQQSGAGTSNGVAAITAGPGLNSTGPASNPTLNSLIILGRVLTLSGSLPATIGGEDGHTYTLFTGQFNIDGGNTANTIGVPNNSGAYNVADPVVIRLASTSTAVVVAKLI